MCFEKKTGVKLNYNFSFNLAQNYNIKKVDICSSKAV